MKKVLSAFWNTWYSISAWYLTFFTAFSVIFLSFFYCSIRPVIRLPVPNILSVCKAEEGGDAVASLTDDNAADGKTGGAESLITGRMEY